MNKKGVSAKALLIAVLAMARISARNGNEFSYSENESRAILSALTGSQVLQILDASKTRDLDSNEAQILQSLKEKGAKVLVAGLEPMY